MYKVLDKDTIKNEILPHLSVAKRGYICQSCLSEVIQCILYKLKTGCQWYMLPVSSFFTAKVLHYKTVYGHFRKWCKKGEWQKVWTTLLSRYKSFLDMSSIDLDGSHTTALRGGKCSHNSQSLIFLLMDYFSMLMRDSMQKSLGTCA